MTDTEAEAEAGPRTNFLGIPIEGDGDRRRDQRTPQRPLSEIEPIIQALLDDPYIREFGWHQYTPYFNDGDPCEFGIYDPYFLTVDDPAREEIDELYAYEIGDHPTLGTRNFRYIKVDDKRVREDLGYEGAHEDSYERARALAKALGSDAFDHAMEDLFGDHADIMITKDKIVVDDYHHD